MPKYSFLDKIKAFLNISLFLTLCFFLWVLGAQTVYALGLILAIHVVILILCIHNADTLNIA